MLKLLSIGQRVTHFDGGPSTHGKGTVVGYNNVKLDNYIQENPRAAAEAIGQIQDPQLRSQMMGAAVSGMYDAGRYPYVVHWDPRTDGSEIALEYPQGYKDVYGDECRPIPN